MNTMINQITGHTRLTGLLGSPVEHSISPMMHNEAFQQLGLDYVYLAFDVGTDKLKTAVEGLRTLNVRGFNLTMPDKNLMVSLCDDLSTAARIIGAVNTVVNARGGGCWSQHHRQKDDTTRCWRRRNCNFSAGCTRWCV